MRDREAFTTLAVQHGMRHAGFTELAEVKGYLKDIDTHEKRLAAVQKFKQSNEHLFGTGADHARPMLVSMVHFRADGKSDGQKAADRASQLDRHIGAQLGRLPQQSKRATEMSRKEADELQRAILEREAANNRIAYQRQYHSHVLGDSRDD